MSRFSRALTIACFVTWLVALAHAEKPHAVFVVGTTHYSPQKSLPPLAERLASFGFETTVVVSQENPEKNAAGIPGLEALAEADVAIFYLRFLTLPEAQFAHIRDYLESGRPVVGFRTATHAFAYPEDHALAEWNDGFGSRALGSKYFIHGQGPTRVIAAGDSELLAGTGYGKDPREAAGTLYLSDIPDDATVILRGTGRFKRTGTVTNGFGTHELRAEMTDDVAWTWENEWGGRVFATTLGHERTFADAGFVRFCINGIHWAAGVELPDAKKTVAAILPAAAENREASRKQTGTNADAGAGQGAAMNRTRNQRDAKHEKTGKPEPERDPSLAEFGIYADSAPNPERVEAVKTVAPLALEPGDRIAFVGNTLFDRAQEFAFLESLLYLAFPEHELVIRNFAWSADEVDLQPRPDNFATVAQHLTREKIDVVFAAFGFNESFGGPEKLDAFRARLATQLDELRTSAFNGESAPRIVLVSPIANENTPGVPAADLNNENIALYTEAMADVAEEKGVLFADVFAYTRDALADPDSILTINGAHLTEEGYRVFAEQVFRETFEESPPPVNEELRAVAVDKNRQYFRRYRPLNTFYYTGGRNKKYGYLDFLPAMRNFEILTANREERAWALAKGEDVTGPVDDSNAPPLEAVAESIGANEWLSPADELAAFDIDPRFEVNLFASEEEFPEIACPIQLRWDAKGRLWVSCSTTYPHVYPGQEPNDKIVILEDTDKDGRADKSTVWADDVHIPLSFELTANGIYVSEEPHLTLIEDTDGDDRADKRTIVYTGFGTEDSHHALHDFVWTPDGDLLFRESIFHNSQVETPYGPVRAKNSAWFQLTPRNQRLHTFGSYPNTNPWGVTFDDWGHHVASHPNFASAFHSKSPPYPEQQPKATGISAYSGTCGHEFVDFASWPEELQGGFIKARYKPTNRIEIHRWIRNEDHYAEEYVSDLIFSRNLSFIPVDIGYGPRGAMYVCDWYNPVKGHAQYALRDPRRDRTSGRIWRITPKGAELRDPPPIAGATIEQLLENLKCREYRYRYWSKRELRERNPAEVESALDQWVTQLDSGAERFRHHQLEALWTYRGIGATRPALLEELIGCEIPDARAAATRQLRYLAAEFNDGELALLARAATDEDAIVRLEAVIAATWIGTPDALEAVVPVYGQPMGDHLRFAAWCALISEPLVSHGKDNPAFLAKHPEPLRTETLEPFGVRKDQFIVIVFHRR